jgi:hypothetical protein
MKKSKYLILTIPLFTFISCTHLFYNNYQKFDDEFRNNKKLIARIIQRPEERRTEITSAYIIIEREISEKQDNVKAFVVIARSSTSFKIENTGYLKADNQSFVLNISNPVSEYKSKNETSVSTYSKTDSTGVSTGQTTDIDERIWIDDKFIFSLTPEMTTKIKKSNEIILRFYFGPIPATFRISGSKLIPINKVLNF